MKKMKRLLAMLLCVIMVVGLIPASVFAAETVLDAAIFCSDVHGSTNDLTSVLGGVKTSGVNYSSIGFVGDTCLTVANTTSTVQSALGDTDIDVMFSYAASHDTENGADISTNWNYSGEVEGVSDYYLVYTIRETDMRYSEDADTAAPAFTTWYNGLTDAEKALPIFIMSHRPLHERRNDNDGAATWYEAISAAAESSDIVFFWAHNHTGESSVDTNAYYVAKDGSETITVEGGSTVTPNFTYMNAGYINANNQNPARIGVATTVQITADSLIFQDYNSSGAYTGSYAHNVTVKREFANTTTVSSIAISGTTEYAIGDELELTVTATYSDGTTADVTAAAVLSGYDMSVGGVYTVTAEYEGLTAEYAIQVNPVTVSVECANSDIITATGDNLTGITAEWKDIDLTAAFGDADPTVYDIALTGYTENQSVQISLDIVGLPVDGLKLYYVNADGTTEAITPDSVTATDVGAIVTFTTTKVGTFAVGVPEITVPTGADLTGITVTAPETTKYFVEDANADDILPLDITGLTVTATYSDGTTTAEKEIEWNEFGAIADGYSLTFDMTKLGYQDVTVSYTYTGTAEVTETGTFQIWIGSRTFTSSDETVSVTVENPGTTAIVVSDEITDAATAAIAHLVNDYAVYNITLASIDGKGLDGGTASVTLPVPEGVENPAVYYVSDDGKTVTNMNATVNSDGTVTFTTDHFSTYVVGESTEIEVPDPTTSGTVTGTTTTTESKDVYVLVSSISGAGDYLIVNTNSATTSAHLLTASNNGVTDTSNVTVTTGTNAAGNTVTYIEDPAAAAIWTATANNNGYRMYNSNTRRYLRVRSSQLTTTDNSSQASTMIGSNNTFYRYNDDYYVYYNNGWACSDNSQTVYIYQKQTVEFATTTTATGEYSIAGNPAEVSKVVENGTTATLGSTLTFTPESGSATTTDTSTTATYTVVDGGDPNGIISDISGNTVTFSGKYGKALVKVTYTSTDPAYTVTNYIVVEATAPVYDIEISEDGTTALNDTIAVRGVTENQEKQLSYILTYEDADGVQNLTPSSGITWECYLEDGSDASSIASIDQTGKLTFTGAEGTIKVKVAYKTSSGTTVDDIVTINVRESNAVTPDESTSDFPRWPNEGAVRFNKTASAIGNFSETGIAQVELSMAGIPVKTGGDVDVVIMLDMTGSMSDGAMAAAEESAIAFAEQIVKNDDGTYNDSRIAILAFNSGSSSPYTYWELGTVENDDEWSSLCTAVRNASENQVSGGTPYDEALAKCQEILAAAKTDGTGDNRQQFCVFVSDGGPTSYEYITNYDEVKAGTDTAYTTSTASATGGANQSDSNFATIATYTHEYYSTLMKDSGVTMYSVLTGLSADDYPNCTTILQNIASDSSKAYVVEDGTDTSAITNAFTAIAEEINAAATNVNVEDVITDEYDLIFELPNSNITGLPAGQEFYLEVVDYPLDETTHERTGASNIKQRIYLATDASGKVYISKIVEENLSTEDTTDTTTTEYTVDNVPVPTYTEKAKDTDKAYFDANGTYYPKGDGTHHMTSGAYVVLNDDGSLKSLHTVNFTYVVETKQLNWTVTSMSETSEVALRYFVYLKDSGGVDPDQQVDAGTYPTNVYASLTYTNHLGTECLQYFPKPQMTWNGAQVSYVFYLVNENGVPVNRAGREVTFAEAVFVTDIYTHAIVWNDLEQSAGLEASYLAEKLIPDAYSLYDVNASYKIHVYEDEEGVNLNNHFVIAGTSGDTTTYVYNNKTDVNKYNVHGTYAATSTYLCKSYSVTDTAYTANADGTYTVTAATYTAVAGETQVAWDDLESTTGASNVNGYAYYVDENGDVYTIVQKTDATAVTGFDFANTTVAFAVVWEQKLVEDTVVVDFGLPVDIDVVSNDFVYNYITGIGATDPNYGINEGYKTDTAALTATTLTVDGHSVKVQDQNHIRFTPGNGTSMEFDAPVKFYYETTVEVYENSQVVPSYMYSSVTVIPATTVYYEDQFVTLKTYIKDTADSDEDGDNTDYTESTGWDVDSVRTNATQDQDRPGTSQISETLDADNNYGYDSAYAQMSQFSMGSAAKVTVQSGKYATAEFEFYGTGFDVISMTDTTTGTIYVDVYNEAGTKVVSESVNTYYGYMRTQNTDGTYTWEVVANNDPNALYQVPVIKIGDGDTTEALTYGKYKAVITVSYASFLDSNKTDASYDFYLDAVRIYNPCGSDNATANNAYIADGEYLPTYFELRNSLITADDFNVLTDDETVSGMVFIDGTINGADNTASVSDYTSYGPNNELYLEAGNAVAFTLSAPAKAGYDVESVQIAVKTVGGTGYVKIYDATSTTAEKTTALKIETATDMYYDITDLNGKTVVILNSGTDDAIISITNLKVTYKNGTATTSDEGVPFLLTRSVASAAVMSLRVEEEVETEQPETETTVPEETEPETTVPEETEPETTEPEETEPEVTEPEETEPEETEPEEDPAEEIKNTITNIINKITNALSNLLSRWFR